MEMCSKRSVFSVQNNKSDSAVWSRFSFFIDAVWGRSLKVSYRDRYYLKNMTSIFQYWISQAKRMHLQDQVIWDSGSWMYNFFKGRKWRTMERTLRDWFKRHHNSWTLYLRDVGNTKASYYCFCRHKRFRNNPIAHSCKRSIGSSWCLSGIL